jgi:hypothetical protein
MDNAAAVEDGIVKAPTTVENRVDGVLKPVSWSSYYKLPRSGMIVDGHYHAQENVWHFRLS